MVRVSANPAVRLEVSAADEEVRTGDVVWFEARALDASGNEVPDFPIQYAVSTRTPDTLVAPGAAAFVEPDGAFVAERPGLHTVVASGGSLTARETIRAVGRNLKKDWGDRGPGSGARPAHLGPVGLGGPRRPRLRDHRHLGRRRARLLLGRDRSVEHPPGGHRPGGRPHRERRQGLPRTASSRSSAGKGPRTGGTGWWSSTSRTPPTG